MEKETKKETRKEVKTESLNVKEVTTCEATQQMLKKAEKDGVETAFHRAASMKACPIGAQSACCKHCAMGPCRLNAKDPYGKVGVCGATVDTIMARNFARMVASGAAAHTDHGMTMLDVFREVVNGNIQEAVQGYLETYFSIQKERSAEVLRDQVGRLYRALKYDEELGNLVNIASVLRQIEAHRNKLAA